MNVAGLLCIWSCGGDGALPPPTEPSRMADVRSLDECRATFAWIPEVAGATQFERPDGWNGKAENLVARARNYYQESREPALEVAEAMDRGLMAVSEPMRKGLSHTVWIVARIDGCQALRVAWGPGNEGLIGSGDSARAWQMLPIECPGGTTLEIAPEGLPASITKAVRDGGLCLRRNSEPVTAAAWVEALDLDDPRYLRGIVDARTGEELVAER